MTEYQYFTQKLSHMSVNCIHDTGENPRVGQRFKTSCVSEYSLLRIVEVIYIKFFHYTVSGRTGTATQSFCITELPLAACGLRVHPTT